MEHLVRYQLDAAVATVTMDDGKVNVMSRVMPAAVHDALDRAEADQAVVLLTGRPGPSPRAFRPSDAASRRT